MLDLKVDKLFSKNEIKLSLSENMFLNIDFYFLFLFFLFSCVLLICMGFGDFS